MSKRAPRAPAGAVAVANQVRALVSDVGKKAAGQVLGVSPGRAAQLARAAERGNIGKVFHTADGLAAWKDRVNNVVKHAPPEVREVLLGQRAPEHHPRAHDKAGRQRQTEAGLIRAQYSDKEIAKQAGISRQKATAIRLQIAAGREPKPEDRKKFDTAVQQLINDKGIIDGVNIIPKAQADRILAAMTKEERAAHSADKRFGNWADAKKWVKGVHGAPKSIVKAYNKGTASNPQWSFVISYEEDEGYGDDGPGIDEPPEPPPPPKTPAGPTVPSKYQNKSPGFLRNMESTKERAPDSDAGQFVGERLH